MLDLVQDSAREDNQEIRRGSELIGRLRGCDPANAPAAVSAIFEDAKQVLRVPLVDDLLRWTATFPDFLQAAWNATRPNLSSLALERATDGLRAEAVHRWTRSALDAVLDPDEAAKARRYTDTMHYLAPKLLVIASAWHEQAKLCAGGSQQEEPEEEAVESDSRTSVHASSVGRGILPGSYEMRALDLDAGDERTRALLDAIQNRYEHPIVCCYFRGLAACPDLLETIWQHVTRDLFSYSYLDTRLRLIERAAEIYVSVCRLPAFDPAILSQASWKDLRAMLSVFRFRLLPDLLISVCMVKALLDGSEAARYSRFSALYAPLDRRKVG
jgi:hypothetical protein